MLANVIFWIGVVVFVTLLTGLDWLEKLWKNTLRTPKRAIGVIVILIFHNAISGIIITLVVLLAVSIIEERWIFSNLDEDCVEPLTTRLIVMFAVLSVFENIEIVSVIELSALIIVTILDVVILRRKLRDMKNEK